MKILEEIVEMCIMLIPTLGVVAVVYVILTKYFENQQKTLEAEWKQRTAKDYLPIQMQAYERLVLLLERISAERLVFRVNKPGMSARMMQAEMLKVIRDEFDHNLTQQLYISNEAWAAVNAAREETIRILNMAADRTSKDGSSIEFSTAILETLGGLKKAPTEVAIDFVKAEYRKRVRLINK